MRRDAPSASWAHAMRPYKGCAPPYGNREPALRSLIFRRTRSLIRATCLFAVENPGVSDTHERVASDKMRILTEVDDSHQIVLQVTITQDVEVKVADKRQIRFIWQHSIHRIIPIAGWRHIAVDVDRYSAACRNDMKKREGLRARFILFGQFDIRTPERLQYKDAEELRCDF